MTRENKEKLEENGEIKLKFLYEGVGKPLVARLKCQKREKVIWIMSNKKVYYEGKKLAGVIFSLLLNHIVNISEEIDLNLEFEYSLSETNCSVCLRNIKKSDKIIICYLCHRKTHASCQKGEICKPFCKSFKVFSKNTKNKFLINDQACRRSDFYQRLVNAMKTLFQPITEKELEDDVTKKLEKITEDNPNLRPPIRAPVAGPKEWIDEVNKKAKVNTIIDEVENNLNAKEIVEEILIESTGVEETEAEKKKRKNKNTIDELFKRMKESQAMDRPGKEKGVETKRLAKEREKNLDEVSLDAVTETIASLKSALGIEKERLNVEKNLTKTLKQYSKSLERKLLVNKGHVELDNPDLILSSEEKSILLAMSSTLKDQQEQLDNICNVLSNFSSDNILKRSSNPEKRKEDEAAEDNDKREDEPL